MTIQHDGFTVTDTMDKLVQVADGGYRCKCSGMLTMTAHVDGTDFYATTYQCDCGNVINVSMKRSEEDMMIWESEE